MQAEHPSEQQRHAGGEDPDLSPRLPDVENL
jgi:hypothetical protein